MRYYVNFWYLHSLKFRLNIYNSLGAFFLEKGDIPRAELCLMQAKAVCENFCIPIEEFPVLVDNLITLENRKRLLIE